MKKHSKATNQQLEVFLQYWMCEKSPDKMLLIDGNQIIISDGSDI